MTELESGGVLTSPPLPSQTKPKLPPGCGHQRPLCRDRRGGRAGVAPVDLAGSHQRNRGQSPSPRLRWEPGCYRPRPHPQSQAPHGPCHPSVERTACLEMIFRALLHCEDCELIQFTASGAAGGGCDGGDLRLGVGPPCTWFDGRGLVSQEQSRLCLGSGSAAAPTRGSSFPMGKPSCMGESRPVSPVLSR